MSRLPATVEDVVSSGALGVLLSGKFRSLLLQHGSSLTVLQAAVPHLLPSDKRNSSNRGEQVTEGRPRTSASCHLAAFYLAKARPFFDQAARQRQLGRPVLPSTLPCWTTDRRQYSCDAAAALAAGQQGRTTATTSSSSSDSSQACSNSSSSSSDSSHLACSSSSRAKVESILASAGLDPAELRRYHPLAYSLLTVPLARVLAEVHTDRLSTKARLMLHPAQLMARICFLAYDVGLTAEQIRARHGQETDTLRFDLEGAQQLLAWLRLQHVSFSQLKIATMSCPLLWATDVGAAQRSKQHVQQRLGVTDAQWVKAFNLQPKGFASRPEVLDGVIAWLEAEPLGFSTADIRQLWQSSPRLFAASAATLQHNLQSLLSRCPLSKQQLRSFMRGRCSLLCRDCDGLLAKLASLVAELPGLEARLGTLLAHGGTALSLEEGVLLGKVARLLNYGFSKQELARVFSNNSMALTNSWDGKLQPVLAALEDVVGSRQAVVAAVSKAPSLLGMALATIDDNLRVLKAAGLPPDEVRGSVVRQPQLFYMAYASPEFQAKLRYFDEVLGRAPRQMLIEYPAYLKSSLRRIDYRVSFKERKGDTHHRTSLNWIPKSDEKFCQQ